uniref:Ig-like domain-containing protein n=1 Tax=Nothobranchius furzeri TaxID=105023 RepID=A0A8C6M1R4_NOTFU
PLILFLLFPTSPSLKCEFLFSDYCVNFYENITAEAGLCVEISCSFITSSYFKPTNLVWYKCESSRSKCGDSDIILHTNNENKVQSRFRGRVSLLEPKLHHGNCSIIISNLQESDSGSYQLRVNGYVYGRGTGFTYNTRTTKSSTLQQKPTLVVPPLTEGQQTTLTCTAPGLCPGSPPNITWSSTLTFNPSAEHHGTNITCKISFTGDTTTEETVTLNVTCEYNFLLYRLLLQIAGATTAEEGDALTLTCTADSSPPPLITWTKLGFNTSLVNRNGSLIIPNVTAGDSGLYICTIKNLNTTLTEKVDVKVKCKFVKHVRKPKIAGKTVIKEGDTLTLNCTADTFPPSLITWTKSGTNKTLSNKTAPDSGTSDLLVHNVTAEDSGHYLCTSNYLNTSTQDVNVTVISKVELCWVFFLYKKIHYCMIFP